MNTLQDIVFENSLKKLKNLMNYVRIDYIVIYPTSSTFYKGLKVLKDIYNLEYSDIHDGATLYKSSLEKITIKGREIKEIKTNYTLLEALIQDLWPSALKQMIETINKEEQAKLVETADTRIKDMLNNLKGA